MLKNQDINSAFDQDVERFGSYQYTKGTRYSTIIANERYTQMILSSVDFTGKSVVDIGSGDGTYTAHLAKRSNAASILGIEPAPKAVERARAVYGNIFSNLNFVCGYPDILIKQKKRFDIAVYRGVIHHMASPRDELSKAFLLADTLIVLEPNGLNPLMKIVEKLSSYHKQHQERSFLHYSISRWITEGGGVIKKICFFGMVPYFCPYIIAIAGKFIEPFVESLPVLRSICCGQYLVVATRGGG
ncbi:MAG: class I SAM-dependent methyltransferase [Candidatus Omnitrophota bacterium]